MPAPLGFSATVYLTLSYLLVKIEGQKSKTIASLVLSNWLNRYGGVVPKDTYT
jgi:hypothetical protein